MENGNLPPTNNRPILPAALRARMNQELHELHVILTFVDSRLESIKQFLKNFSNQLDETNMNNLESDDELVDTPIVYPFPHSDNDSDDSEVLNELCEDENVGMPCNIVLMAIHSFHKQRDVDCCNLTMKPIREDELLRIKDQEGKVISWNVARVLGVLDMSRATCDRYLRSWIILVPNITFTTRTSEDAWLIIASDGLSDVMTNNKVDEVARMFKSSAKYSLIKIKEHIKKRPPLAASEKVQHLEYKDNVYGKMVGSPKGYEVSVKDLDKPLSLLSEKKTKLEQEDVDRICKIFLISCSMFRKRIKDINECLRSKLIDEELEIVDAKDSNKVIPPGDELKTILKEIEKMEPGIGVLQEREVQKTSLLETKKLKYELLDDSSKNGKEKKLARKLYRPLALPCYTIVRVVHPLVRTWKESAKDVLKELKTMVIKTAMVTGDYQATTNQEKR
nr:probable protein phosphatase 2C 6 [Tanacetum cinerariifolium]